LSRAWASSLKAPVKAGHPNLKPTGAQYNRRSSVSGFQGSFKTGS